MQVHCRVAVRREKWQFVAKAYFSGWVIQLNNTVFIPTPVEHHTLQIPKLRWHFVGCQRFEAGINGNQSLLRLTDCGRQDKKRHLKIKKLIR